MKTTILLSTLTLLLILSCKNDEELNSESKILNMNFDFGQVEFIDTVGNINALENTNIKKLIPVIEISPGATIYPESGTLLDFSESVTFTVTSEDKTNQSYYTITVNMPVANIVVYDCSNWTAEDPDPKLVQDANVEIFETINNQKVKIMELRTDDNGEVVLYGDRNKTYFARVSKGNASSTKNGYLIVGIAQNQEQVDYYRQYYMPNLEIGDIIYVDLNGDARLDEQDKSDYVYVYYDEGRPLLKEIFISE